MESDADSLKWNYLNPGMSRAGLISSTMKCDSVSCMPGYILHNT